MENSSSDCLIKLYHQTKNKHLFLIQPTGSGKTRKVATFFLYLIWNGYIKYVVCVIPRDLNKTEVLYEFREVFRSLYSDNEISKLVKAMRYYDFAKFADYKTENCGFFIDEAHHLIPRSKKSSNKCEKKEKAKKNKTAEGKKNKEQLYTSAEFVDFVFTSESDSDLGEVSTDTHEIIAQSTSLKSFAGLVGNCKGTDGKARITYDLSPTNETKPIANLNVKVRYKADRFEFIKSHIEGKFVVLATATPNFTDIISESVTYAKLVNHSEASRCYVENVGDKEAQEQMLIKFFAERTCLPSPEIYQEYPCEAIYVVRKNIHHEENYIKADNLCSNSEDFFFNVYKILQDEDKIICVVNKVIEASKNEKRIFIFTYLLESHRLVLDGLDKANIKYYSFTKNTKKKEFDEVLQKFNNSNEIKILVASSIFGEGHNLKNIDQVHLVDACFTCVSTCTLQGIGRALRLYSHNEFKKVYVIVYCKTDMLTKDIQNDNYFEYSRVIDEIGMCLKEGRRYNYDTDSDSTTGLQEPNRKQKKSTKTHTWQKQQRSLDTKESTSCDDEENNQEVIDNYQVSEKGRKCEGLIIQELDKIKARTVRRLKTRKTKIRITKTIEECLYDQITSSSHTKMDTKNKSFKEIMDNDIYENYEFRKKNSDCQKIFLSEIKERAIRKFWKSVIAYYYSHIIQTIDRTTLDGINFFCKLIEKENNLKRSENFFLCGEASTNCFESSDEEDDEQACADKYILYNGKRKKKREDSDGTHNSKFYGLNKKKKINKNYNDIMGLHFHEDWKSISNSLVLKKRSEHPSLIDVHNYSLISTGNKIIDTSSRISLDCLFDESLISIFNEAMIRHCQKLIKNNKFKINKRKTFSLISRSGLGLRLHVFQEKIFNNVSESFEFSNKIEKDKLNDNRLLGFSKKKKIPPELSIGKDMLCLSKQELQCICDDILSSVSDNDCHNFHCNSLEDCLKLANKYCRIYDV